MRLNKHGIVSFGLVSSTWLVAILYGTMQSAVGGFIGLGVTVLALSVVLRRYCSKCPGRNGNCAHYVVGKMANRFFEDQCHKSYSKRDIGMLMIALTAMTGVHLWLLRTSLVLLMVYLAITAVAVVEITMFVCTDCCNRKCPLNRSSAETGGI